MTPQGTAATLAEPQLRSIEEAAVMLGVSKRWLEDALARGDLPSVRLGRRRLLRAGDIAAFIEAHLEPKGRKETAMREDGP